MQPGVIGGKGVVVLSVATEGISSDRLFTRRMIAWVCSCCIMQLPHELSGFQRYIMKRG